MPLAHQLIASVTTIYKEEWKIVDSGFSDITAQSEQIAPYTYPVVMHVVMKCRDEIVTANDEYTGSNSK